MTGRDVVVACAADAGYAMPLAVMLRSARETLDPSRRLTAYVIDDGMTEALRARVADSLPTDVRLRWIPAEHGATGALHRWGRISSATFQRLLLPGLLPASEERAIWLDCDLVVTADLGRLWDSDMGGHHLLAVRDMGLPSVSCQMGVPGYAALGIPADAPYLNAGVLVVHLGRWRRDGIAEEVLRYLDRRGDRALFMDQEGLNAVLHGRWGELDVRWNVNASLAGRAFHRPHHLDPAARRRAADDPWILHYAGSIKPWLIHDTGDPGRARWFAHLDRTAWSGWRPAPSLRRRLVASYEDSRLRRVVYPVEARGFAALGALSRTRRRLAARRHATATRPRRGDDR